MKKITNGRVWTSSGLRAVQIWIDDAGKIAALSQQDLPLPPEETIDAQGSLILPGGIDMHAHLQDGAETFYPGTCAAVIGGITTIVDMPPFHACATLAGCQARLRQAQAECVSDFCLGGGIVVSPEDLTEISQIAQAGAPYFKVFMPSEPPVDTALLWRCVRAAAHSGLRMAIHMEASACLEPVVDWQDPLGFAHSRPEVAETSATAQVLEMARAAGAPVHVCHVSCGRTAELVDAYRGWGADVTAETTPHFLIFDESEFLRQGARVKTTPPLRQPEDVESLWDAVAAGVIDAVVSDHYLGALPGSIPKSLRDAEAGIAGLEVSLPLLYDAGVSQNRISLERFVQVTAECPARILGIAGRKGALAPGMDADMVFLDPQANWPVAAVGPASRVEGLPYAGRTLSCRVIRTLVRGGTAWDGKEICAARGSGHHQPSNPRVKQGNTSAIWAE